MGRSANFSCGQGLGTRLELGWEFATQNPLVYERWQGADLEKQEGLRGDAVTLSSTT
jgi:hypothetical protein